MTTALDPLPLHLRSQLDLGDTDAPAVDVLDRLPRLPPHIRYSDDQPRDEGGRFGEGGGSSGGDSGKAGGVRQSLADANTAGEVSAAAAIEARAITGRDIPFDYEGVEPQLAREYSEGVLQGLERFPDAPLGAVRAADFPAEPSDTHTYAHALRPEQGTSGQYEIEFNRDNDAERINETLHMKQARGGFAYGDPEGLALHEFGHVMHESQDTADKASATAWRWARERTSAPATSEAPRQRWWRPKSGAAVTPGGPSGDDVRITLMREISFYSVTNSHELAAEAFADVMVNGDGASAVSHIIMDQLETTIGGA